MIDPDAIERATFRALARCFLVACEAVAGPDVRAGARGPLVFGATTIDLAGMNRIMTADGDAAPNERDIEAVMAEVALAPIASWWIPPGPAAAAIEATLADRGFIADPDDPTVPAMWISLEALPDLDLGSDVTIEPAISVAAVGEASLVAAAGFGLAPSIAAPLTDLFSRVGDQPASPSHVFLACLDGRPVASALAVVAGEAVAIYNVATLPHARGRGIGSAITLAALHDGLSRGATLGVLESSELGYSVYRRLGFLDAGRFRVLVRRRPAGAAA